MILLALASAYHTRPNNVCGSHIGELHNHLTQEHSPCSEARIK
jgi:hypothetical protein